MVFSIFSPPVNLVLSPDMQAHALQMSQVAIGHMPRDPVVPLLVLIEHIILHLPLGVNVLPTSPGKGSAGVTGKGVKGRLELRWEDAHEWRAPSFTTAAGCPRAILPPAWPTARLSSDSLSC